MDTWMDENPTPCASWNNSDHLVGGSQNITDIIRMFWSTPCNIATQLWNILYAFTIDVK
jgi:hypothetical protein